MEALEEHIAHMARQLDDLSEIVTRQETEITRLNRQVAMLMQREAQRETEGGAVVLGDERPPHW